MPEERMRKISYEPKIVIMPCVGETFKTDYMNSLYVYRMPLLKSGSFSVVTIPMSHKQYADIDESLKTGCFPDIIITFNLSDMDNRRGKQGFKKLPPAIEYGCKILHALPRTNITSQSKLVPVSLYIAHLFIHEMSLGNSFNNIQIEKTADEMLNSFEAAMYDRFNQQIGFRKLCTYPANDYKYEFALMKSATDITIPNILLNTYKAYNDLYYYFFDDFDIFNKPVVGIRHGLGYALGELWRIFEDDDKFDLSRSIRFKGAIQLNDKQRLLNRLGGSILIRNENWITKTIKEPDMEVGVPQLKIGPIDDSIYKENRRTRHNKIIRIYGARKPSNVHTSVYTPDTFDNAIDRYNKSSLILQNMAESIYKFEAFETHIDAIQLYRMYTLDQTDLSSFYVPINIVNVFSRIDPHQTPVSHTAQFQCIKYPGNN